MRGGKRAGAGRRPTPRLSPHEARALLVSLCPNALTVADYARALGCRPERVREAIAQGCTERRAGEWRSKALADCAGSTAIVPR